MATILDANRAALTKHAPELLQVLAQPSTESRHFHIEMSEVDDQAVLVRQCGDDASVFVCHPGDPARFAALEISRFRAQVNDRVLCLGFGAGHRVRELLAAVGPRGRVDVLLLHPSSLGCLCSAVDISDIVSHPCCHFIWGDVSQVAAELNRCFADNPRVYYHEPSLRAADQALRPLVGAVQRTRRQRLQHLRASRIVRENYRANLGWVGVAHNLGELRGVLAGHPAVVVAAGPSLDRNVDQLKRCEGKAAILCVDTALRRVIRSGATIDLALTTDPNRASVRHFDDLDLRIPLAFLPSTFPEVLRMHRGPKLMAFPNGDPFAEHLARLSGHVCVEIAGTVSYFGIEIARLLGCNPILFVGLDLALTGGRTHCSASRSSSGSSIRLQVPAIDGAHVETTELLDRYRRAIEFRIAEDSSCHYVDATEGGALIKGTEVCSLGEAVDRWCNGCPPLPSAFGGLTARGPGEPNAQLLAAWHQVFGRKSSNVR